LTVADLGKPIEQIWHCLVRDADGTSLLPPDVSPQQVSAEVVNELLELAMSNPTQAPE
jgi:hypothetical protein